MMRHARTPLLVMQPTRWLLIGLLLLASAGCAQRDWVSDLLVLTDVTGTWDGTVKGWVPVGAPPQTDRPRPIKMVLQQTGPKVTGELSWLGVTGRVEGSVAGEVLTFSEGIRGELLVDGDEMWGSTRDRMFTTTTGASGCRPCFLRFRRGSAPVPAPSEPPTRREP